MYGTHNDDRRTSFFYAADQLNAGWLAEPSRDGAVSPPPSVPPVPPIINRQSRGMQQVGQSLLNPDILSGAGMSHMGGIGSSPQSSSPLGGPTGGPGMPPPGSIGARALEQRMSVIASAAEARRRSRKPVGPVTRNRDGQRVSISAPVLQYSTAI